MSLKSTVTLRDQNKMPQLGFGVWQIPDADAEVAVQEAFKAGYQAIDTAAIYRNEVGVGQAIKKSGIERGDMFITTKLWNEDQGYDQALKAFDASLDRLGLDYVDLYLVHWPAPQKNQYVDSWRALVEIKKQGRAKSIGVSNFMPEHLENILQATAEVPVLNQVELHPRFQQKELRSVHAKHGIFTESWSPLGQGKLLQDSVILSMAKKHKKSSAQVIIRWHLQSNLIVIPKSATPSRIKENFNVFDFELDSEDMNLMSSLDSVDGRIGPNPREANF